jgi:hypothetical protein
VAYGVVNPALVAWLMRSDHAIPLRFEGSDILTWRPGRLSPSRIMPTLDLLVEVASLVPQYVRDAGATTQARTPHREASRRAARQAPPPRPPGAPPGAGATPPQP